MILTWEDGSKSWHRTDDIDEIVRRATESATWHHVKLTATVEGDDIVFRSPCGCVASRATMSE